MIDTMLAAAAALMSPVSGGRRVGMAKKAILAVNRTAACVFFMLFCTTFCFSEQGQLTLMTSCCHPFETLVTNSRNGAWKTILSM